MMVSLGQNQVQQGHTLAGGSRGGSFLASSSFWRLLAVLGCGRTTPSSASTVTLPCPLCLNSPSVSLLSGHL